MATVEVVNDGFWVQLTCDGKCSESKPKDEALYHALGLDQVPCPDERLAIPKGPDQKTNWCTLLCDRAKLNPENPLEGVMCFMLSMRTKDGKKHGFYGKAGMRCDPGDGFVYRVIREKSGEHTLKKEKRKK